MKKVQQICTQTLNKYITFFFFLYYLSQVAHELPVISEVSAIRTNSNVKEIAISTILFDQFIDQLMVLLSGARWKTPFYLKHIVRSLYLSLMTSWSMLSVWKLNVCSDKITVISYWSWTQNEIWIGLSLWVRLFGKYHLINSYQMITWNLDLFDYAVRFSVSIPQKWKLIQIYYVIFSHLELFFIEILHNFQLVKKLRSRATTGTQNWRFFISSKMMHWMGSSSFKVWFSIEKYENMNYIMRTKKVFLIWQFWLQFWKKEKKSIAPKYVVIRKAALKLAMSTKKIKLALVGFEHFHGYVRSNLT